MKLRDEESFHPGGGWLERPHSCNQKRTDVIPSIEDARTCGVNDESMFFRMRFLTGFGRILFIFEVIALMA